MTVMNWMEHEEDKKIEEFRNRSDTSPCKLCGDYVSYSNAVLENGYWFCCRYCKVVYFDGKCVGGVIDE